MLRYKLRTLLIVLAVVPPLLTIGLPLLLFAGGGVLLTALFAIVLVVPAIGVYACWEKRQQSC